MSSDEGTIGPCLPPHMRKETPPSKTSEYADNGPMLPPGFKSNQNSVDEGADIGPALPPHLRKNKDNHSDSIGPAFPLGMTSCSNSNEDTIGPALPPHLANTQNNQNTSVADSSCAIGPVLPPGFQSTSYKSDSDDDDTIGPVLPKNLSNKLIKVKPSDNSSIGPVLPPGFNAKPEEDSIGPALPPHLLSKHKIQGPALPPGFRSNIGAEEVDNDEDDETIGPLPCEMFTGSAADAVALQLESRAKVMRDKLEGRDQEEDKDLKRETWMTELPGVNNLSASLGLTARTFRAKAGPDMSDRSSWTDTPADRERKAKEGFVEPTKKRSHEEVKLSARDKKLKKEVDGYNESKRNESLYDIHQKKIQKAKKETEDEPTERRPFDRDLDLQVNRFDDAKRKAMIKKSQQLDTRFGHGSTQFL